MSLTCAPFIRSKELVTVLLAYPKMVSNINVIRRFGDVFQKRINRLRYDDSEEIRVFSVHPTTPLLHGLKVLESEDPTFYSDELEAIRAIDDIEDVDFGHDLVECVYAFRQLRRRVGSLLSWPVEMLGIFRRSNLNFDDRKKIILFTIVNDLDLKTLFQCLKLLGPLKRNPLAKRIMDDLYTYFLENPESPHAEGAVRVQTGKRETVAYAMRRRPQMAKVAERRRKVGVHYPDRLGKIPEISTDSKPNASILPPTAIEAADALIPIFTGRLCVVPVSTAIQYEKAAVTDFLLREKFIEFLRSNNDRRIDDESKRRQEAQEARIEAAEEERKIHK